MSNMFGLLPPTTGYVLKNCPRPQAAGRPTCPAPTAASVNVHICFSARDARDNCGCHRLLSSPGALLSPPRMDERGLKSAEFESSRL